MKKILVLFILIHGQLFALDRESTLKFYHHMFASLITKPSILVYTNDKEYREVFASSKRIVLAKEPRNADIVLITNEIMFKRVVSRGKVKTQVGQKAILFTTDYRFLKKSEDIIGANYWKKGRSQLLFIQKRLEKYNITLPKEYKDFIIEAL